MCTRSVSSSLYGTTRERMDRPRRALRSDSSIRNDGGAKPQPARARGSIRGPALTSLHREKLRRPATAGHYVRRPRLLDLFEEVARRKLTLVVAPAGTGKTSLVAGWTAESSMPSAWLSLDETDRDLVQFWSGAIAALDTVMPGCGDRALAMLRRAGTRVGAVDQLLADLDARVQPPAVLVIDDFHLVDDDELVDESMSRFVRSKPAWLSVVLISRREPKLPIDRMRSRGQLGEIRLAELRFSSAEAAALMTGLSPALSEERIDAAVRTRRWLGDESADDGARGALTPSADRCAGARPLRRRTGPRLRAPRGAGEGGT